MTKQCACHQANHDICDVKRRPEKVVVRLQPQALCQNRPRDHKERRIARDRTRPVGLLWKMIFIHSGCIRYHCASQVITSHHMQYVRIDP